MLEVGQRFLIVRIWVRMPCHVRTRLQTNAMQCIGKTTPISIVIKESAQCMQNQALFQHNAMLYKYGNS